MVTKTLFKLITRAYLLEQKLNHHMQHQALTKFIGLAFFGSHNVFPEILSSSKTTKDGGTQCVGQLFQVTQSHLQPYW